MADALLRVLLGQADQMATSEEGVNGLWCTALTEFYFTGKSGEKGEMKTYIHMYAYGPGLALRYGPPDLAGLDN